MTTKYGGEPCSGHVLHAECVQVNFQLNEEKPLPGKTLLPAGIKLLKATLRSKERTSSLHLESIIEISEIRN